jgi:WD40 repeat protein/serine/threonine protein kinase
MLAFQNGFVRRDQLLSAMNAWLLDKQTPLEAIFLRQGALNSDQQQLLVALVRQHLSMHDNLAERSLAAISSAGSMREELRSLADPDLNASLIHIAAPVGWAKPGAADAQKSPHDRLATVAPTIGATTSQGTRFRILRPHARGGLGEVHVALDTELKREVALKEIQSPHADHPESRARFTLEAEVTGGLEHPGIVPVYGLGTYADGRPYYAMRFIRGDSLKDAIGRYYRTDWNGKESERSLALRKLLGRFIDVCNAISYAHSRGVLHRDLKPGNIMLGKYGETLVVDWGLAKSLGRSELSSVTGTDTTLPLPDERPLVPASSTGSAPTQMGSALGTPAYMSPEQAAGRLDELGPASDVYSLGATLYDVLTGQPPFVGIADKGELLRQVQRGAFPPPRSVCQSVPKPLEAICLKAMALQSSDRYTTPTRLAEDIEHWLADEPVTAASDTLVERSARFVRKHRSWALSIAAALILIALVSIAAALVINQQRAENATLASAEKTAREIANERRRDAEKLAREKTQLANDMRIELAKNAFAHGITEYDAGRVASADRDLLRAVALLPADHELRPSFAQVAWDRMIRGRRSILPPLRHETPTAQLGPDGIHLIIVSPQLKTARIWDVAMGTPVGELLQHEGELRSIQFSPDGKRVITVGSDKTARVWDAITGARIGEPLWHEADVYDAQFNTNGERVVTAGSNKTARVWDATTGAPVGEPLRHEDEVQSARFSPAGNRVLTISTGTVRIWDIASATVVGGPLQHTSYVNAAEFSPDGKWVLVTQSLPVGTDRVMVLGTPEALNSSGIEVKGDKSARIWDAEKGTPVVELVHDDIVTLARFSPDGRRVITASNDKKARIWDPTTGTLIAPPILHEDYISSVQFSPDGHYALTTSGDLDASPNTNARIWNAATGAAVGQPLRHGTFFGTVQFSSDSKRVVTTGENGARIWESPTGAAVGEPLYEDGVASVQFSPDGQRLITTNYKSTRMWVTAGAVSMEVGGPSQFKGFSSSAHFSGDGKRVLTRNEQTIVRIWDSATGMALGGPLRHESSVDSARFSSDGNRVVTTSDNTARIWDAATGKLVCEPLRHDGPVVSAQFRPDGNRVVTASMDKTARIWNALTGEAVGARLQHEDVVLAAQFSADGARIVTASPDKTARIWESVSGAPVGNPLRHESAVVSAQFSADGKWIVTSSSDNRARVWDVSSGEAVGHPLEHISGIAWPQLSPDAKRLITTASTQSNLHIWDVATGAAVGEPLRHSGPVSSVQFSPDGRLVITASFDKTARVWDVATGTPIGEPLRHKGSVYSAQFSPDGLTVVTSSDDRAAHIWNMRLSPPDERWLQPAMSLWTGYTADAQGNVRQLAADEWYVLAIRFHNSNDPWTVAVRQQWLDMLVDPSERQLAETSKRLNEMPDDENLLYHRVELLACAGKLHEAIADLRSLIRLRPDEHFRYYNLLSLLAATNQPEEYRTVGEMMAERFSDPPTANLEILERVAKGCLFWGDSGADWSKVAPLADRALEKVVANNHWVVDYAKNAKGLADYRRGNYKTALEYVQDIVEKYPHTQNLAVPGNCVKAMSHAQLGQLAEAKIALAAAKKSQASIPTPAEAGAGSFWNDWHIGDIMLREAEAVVSGKAGSMPDGQKDGETM